MIFTNRFRSQTYTVASSFALIDPSAVIAVEGRLHPGTVSNFAEFMSFLFSMCMDTPESTTNYPSSSLISDGACIHQSNECEKNVALFRSRAPRILDACFAKSHASL